MHKYYAYGIRNSFGITFDPITGNLWQTENGPDVYDEINVVKPGFNSGWTQVMGPLSRNTGFKVQANWLIFLALIMRILYLAGKILSQLQI